MIPDFSNIVQKDIVNIIKYVQRPNPSNKERDAKVSLSAIRIFSTLGMAFGALSTFAKLTSLTVNPIGAALGIAISIGIYALSHDAFIMAKNVTQELSKNINFSIFKSAVKDTVNLFTGKKELDDAPRFPETEGTFFETTWNELIAMSAARR